jgi:type IV pilus assembly protein PilY1
VVGFGYPSDPTSRNYTYNWGNCSNLGTRGINNGECRMWGNPIGEMMFEALRYFAGATAHTGYASGGASQGVTEETDLGLPKPAWKDPYKAEAEGGLGYLSCAKPVMTVISDINPSYDSDLPGNPWGTVSIPVPSTLSTFSFATQGEELWEQEFGGSAKNVFIGQVGSATDGQPTSKSASSFGNIRGLAPEEPTKRGSFAAAMVANYGWTKSGGINALSPEKVRTYAIALASPLPRIDFPVDDEGTTISLVPLGKSVGGCFGTDPAGTFQPTNTIVDFYVEQLVNGPGFPEDATVNGGRPYAVFRINYEDVEQGNDHDMDAIVRYEVAVNASGNVDITLRSEYAAGCVIQHMGYVISGTNQDGVYLEVRDYDTSAAASPAHWFNTPPGTTAGQCSADLTTPPCNGGLPLVATRTFTPGVGSESAKLLESPLWYAAKYGGFSDRDGDRKPNLQREWDEDEDGNPDNYFLVTNALSLREQLDEAFARIESDSKVSSAVAASGARKVDGFLAYVPEYSSKDWTGDLKAFQIDADGKIVEPPKWSAVGKLPTLRTIKVAVPAAGDPTKFELKDFTAANIGTDAAAQEAELGFTSGEIATKYGASITPNEIVAFLKGDQTKEVPSTFKDDGIAAAGKVFRYRSRVIGDIVNSQPEVLSRGSFGYTQLPASLGGGRSGAGSYGKFVLETKLTRKPVVFVGSNGGMLHAIDASDGTSAGTELFAVVPNYALPQMGALADPLYARGDDFPYIVDGLMGQGDARIDDSWRSVLLLSPGRGGGGMLGLDVTDPATDGAELLFEFQSPELGNYLWRGQVILAQDNKWYALFGNGVNNASGQPRIFLVDLATGDAKSIAAGSPDAGGTNGMVSIAAVDGGDLGTIGVDGAVFDGKIDTVFGADYAGNIWRFDLSSADPDDWEVAFTNQPLFTAETSGGDPQNITGAINVFLHPTEDFIVYFGSGRFLLEDDLDVPPSPTVESFYAVWGKQQSNRTDLVEQKITKETVVNNQTLRSTTTLPRGASSSGWVIDLAPQGDSGPVGEGERFVGEPRLELGRAIFTTFEVIGDQCAPGGGINRLYSLNAVSGGAELTFDSCTAGSECAPNQSGTVGSVELRDADGGYSAPALSPPLVVNPAGAVIPGKDKCVPGVDPDCPLPDDPEDSLTGRQCLAGLSVLLPEGLRKFSDVQCGRASWRQIR